MREEGKKAVIASDPEPKVVGYVVLVEDAGAAKRLTNLRRCRRSSALVDLDGVLIRRDVFPTLEQAEEHARRLAWSGGKPGRCRIVRVVEQEVARLHFDLSVECDAARSES